MILNLEQQSLEMSNIFHKFNAKNFNLKTFEICVDKLKHDDSQIFNSLQQIYSPEKQIIELSQLYQIKVLTSEPNSEREESIKY